MICTLGTETIHAPTESHDQSAVIQRHHRLGPLLLQVSEIPFS